jgi:hypothetical protein
VNYPDEFGPETRALVQDQLIEPTDEMVQDTLEKVGQTILPTFGIKIGWLF